MMEKAGTITIQKKKRSVSKSRSSSNGSHESSGEQTADRPHTPPKDAAVERAQFPTESIETSIFDEPAEVSDVMGATSFDSSGSTTSVAESVAKSIRSVKSALSRKSDKSSGEQAADKPSTPDEVETAAISIPSAAEDTPTSHINKSAKHVPTNEKKPEEESFVALLLEVLTLHIQTALMAWEESAEAARTQEQAKSEPLHVLAL